MQDTQLGSNLLVVTMLVAGVASAPLSSHPSAEQDMVGIERLHEQDKEATLSDSADQLAKLWDKDGVRLPMDRPAEIGAAVIYADDKQWERSSGRERIRVGIWFGENCKGRQSVDSVRQGDEGHEKTVRRNVEVRQSHGSARPVGICGCVE